MEADSGELTIVALIGGPATGGNNGYLFGINFPFAKPDNYTCDDRQYDRVAVLLDGGDFCRQPVAVECATGASLPGIPLILSRKNPTTAFAVIGANVSDADWDGSPMTLAWHETVTMPQTTNGSMVVAWQNSAAQNNDGTLALTSGGRPPQSFDAPAGALAPTILVQNWKADNLKITNVSANKDTPIWLEAFGPGLPGQTTTPLPAGPSIPVAVRQTLLGSTGGWMQLILQANSGELGLFAVVGGPQDAAGNNAYVFAVNFPSQTTPPGYTKTTMSNTLPYQFNWGGNRIYVVYFGAGAVAQPKPMLGAVPPTVTLLAL